MKLVSRLIAGLLLAGSGTAFAGVDLSKLPAASPKKDVTYEKNIRPMFEASCFRCHGGKEKKGGLSLDSLESVLKGTKEGKVVEPGNALKSQLLISVSQLDPETAMPPKPKARRGGPDGQLRPGDTNAPAGNPGPKPGGPGGNLPPPKPLTPEQVGLVRAWIEQGAK